MSLANLGFGIKELSRDIWRKRMVFLAAFMVVTFSLVVLGGALFTLYRLSQIVAALPAEFEIVAFLRRDLLPEDILSVQRRVADLPGVADARPVTKEQALAQMEAEDRAHGTSFVSALDGENPLPDRLDVRVHDPYQMAAVADQLRLLGEVDKVRDERASLHKLLSLAQLIRVIGAVMAILLFFVAALAIRNTLRFTILARRQEISLMRLVGAPPALIRLPLVLEGLVYGTLGGAAASGILWLVIQRLPNPLMGFLSAIPESWLPSIGPGMMIVVLMAIGMLAGLMGSTLSIERLLKRV